MMTCQPVTCGTPHVFPFTELTFPANKRRILSYGTSAKYKCFEGYSVKGDPEGVTTFDSKCLPTGVLSDPEVCEPIKCGRAPRMEKCRASIAGVVSFGMEVQYECDKGHTLTGTTAGGHHFHRKCEKDGEFEEAEAKCMPIAAGRVPAVRNAKVIQHNGEHVHGRGELMAYYPQGIEYKCNSGYSLTGGPEGQTKFVTNVNSLGHFAPALPAKCKLIEFTVKGEIKNARTGAGLEGAKVKILGTTRARILSEAGFFTLENVAPGRLRLQYTRPGYIPTFKTITVEGDVHSGGICDLNMSPKMQPTQWRAALKWGLQPPDLDTYVKWSTNTVNWANRYVRSGMRGKLEVDDTDGEGPETVYMSGVGSCEGGAHKCDLKYMINDYDETAEMFEKSGASVTLYNGARVAGTWPIGSCPDAISEDRNWWHVFTIDGQTNKLKWHCGMAASLLDVSSGANVALPSNGTEPDFESYVGPFPGRFLRNSARRHRAALSAGAKIPRNLRSAKLPM